MTIEGLRQRHLARHEAGNDAGLSPAGVSPPDRDGTLARAYDRLGEAPAPAASGNVSATHARDVRIKANLDAFRDRFAGPYMVDGLRTPARPMFNMNSPHAMNSRTRAAHGPELLRVCKEVHVSERAVRCALVGRPTPEQLVAVTQALIDAGKLPGGPPGSEALRIRQMQWEWGIGVDCAGYTALAASAAFGESARAMKDNLMGDPFPIMKSSAFRAVPMEDIRPGDVIHLDSAEPGAVGHNVIVHDHREVSGAARLLASRDANTPEAASFWRGEGPFHVLSVDSSWGAGNGNDFGGYRRDTWIFDASSKQWASFAPQNGALELAGSGPQFEVFRGAYRPRSAP